MSAEDDFTPPPMKVVAEKVLLSKAAYEALRERAALADEARHLMDHGGMDEVRRWEDRYDALTSSRGAP